MGGGATPQPRRPGAASAAARAPTPARSTPLARGLTPAAQVLAARLARQTHGRAGTAGGAFGAGAAVALRQSYTPTHAGSTTFAARLTPGGGTPMQAFSSFAASARSHHHHLKPKMPAAVTDGLLRL